MKKTGTKVLLLTILMATASVSAKDTLGLERKSNSQESNDRLIEPTSPILGYDLVLKLKLYNLHP